MKQIRRFSVVAVLVTFAAAGTLVAGGSTVQEFTVKVAGSYSPREIAVTKGEPVRIHFVRKDAANCGGTVVFPDLDIERDLPAGKTTTVDFLPKNSGTLAFTCGMGMMKGNVVVKSN